MKQRMEACLGPSMNVFAYDRFTTLGESDLVAYVEPFLNDPSKSVPEHALGRLLTDLPTYDEYHHRLSD